MYTVGDIVWVVNSSYPGVKPYQVVEETTHKTLNGTMKTFYVKAPSRDSSQVTIDDLGGEIFTSVELVQEELNRRAAAAIEKMIDQGKVLISEYFEQQVVTDLDQQAPQEPIVNAAGAAISAEGIDIGEDNFIVLPDGTKARINIKGNIS